MAEHSPTPWRLDGRTIRDAEGDVVVSTFSPANMETRQLIVEAVNGVEATLKLQRKLLGWSIERDRLRDLVSRLAQRLQMARLMGFGLPERDGLLDAVREALGEAAP